MRTATKLGLVATVTAGATIALLARPHASSETPASSETAAPIRVDHPEPATLPTGRVAVASGSTRTDAAGTPLGFAHSSDGAVAAGTTWLTVLEGSGVLDPSRRSPVLADIGDPAFVSGADEHLDARVTALGLLPDGSPRTGYVIALARPDRGAYRIVSKAGNRAWLDIWYPYQLAVVPDGARPGAARWRRALMTLRWDGTRHDWRLTDVPTFVSGPDPREQLPSFVSRAQVLGAYGSGWHTYAGAEE